MKRKRSPDRQQDPDREKTQRMSEELEPYRVNNVWQRTFISYLWSFQQGWLTEALFCKHVLNNNKKVLRQVEITCQNFRKLNDELLTVEFKSIENKTLFELQQYLTGLYYLNNMPFAFNISIMILCSNKWNFENVLIFILNLLEYTTHK